MNADVCEVFIRTCLPAGRSVFIRVHPCYILPGQNDNRDTGEKKPCHRGSFMLDFPFDQGLS